MIPTIGDFLMGMDLYGLPMEIGTWENSCMGSCMEMEPSLADNAVRLRSIEEDFYRINLSARFQRKARAKKNDCGLIL